MTRMSASRQKREVIREVITGTYDFPRQIGLVGLLDRY